MTITLPKLTDDGRFHGLKVAIVTAGPSSGAQGGAERFYVGLEQGFRALGCDVSFVPVPADEPTVEQILDNYERAAELDLAHYDFVVSGKAPTYAVRHPNHVIYLIHTVRVFDDMFDEHFSKPTVDNYLNRNKVHKADFNYIGSVKARFAIGYEISRRLSRWRGISAQVIHPPLSFNSFRKGHGPGKYFFVPGRLHRWKRFGLLIDAVKQSTLPLRLLIAGEGEHAAEFHRQAAGDRRIEFLGRVDDAQLVSLYSDAIAIPFIPVREDYGYVTLEAFSSGKPVLTCTDSGEPTHLVRNYETGLVVDPDPESICHALEWFWQHPEKAANMGENGYRLVSTMSWRDTAATLAIAALDETSEIPADPVRVSVLDMQPIDPPVGGGRMRLLGLYHHLGNDIACKYVGTYDWPGEKYRSHHLSPSLLEIDVPLSDAHHKAATDLAAKAGGKIVIDLAFSEQAYLSPDFVETARQAVAEAQVVAFSHPWVYPLVKDSLRPNQVVIYDSQNVEGFLRAQLLDGRNPTENDILETVIRDELELGKRADWILACSQEDLLRFHRLYGFTPGKMRVVPNGVMAFHASVPTPESRASAREKLGLSADALIGIFIGSGYGPNIDAAKFINTKLASASPETTFVIAGGVGTELVASNSNVIVTGQLGEADKTLWFHAVDFAINPMMSGSGTNIKMFDFMAMALPVVTTAIGARGIETGGSDVMRVVPPDAAAFADAIADLREPELRGRLGQAGRQCVEDGYAWERISDQLGRFIAMRELTAGQSLPKFSVVIPSYGRPDHLTALLRALQNQVERDFEVVIVDQSEDRWESANEPFGFSLSYYHSPVKGAVRARNTGAMLAKGEIIAFIDDDCLPEPDWLLNARGYFAEDDVVGVEGLIRSDHHDDQDWRPVSNVGFEGVGFMTANLMVRSAAFQFIGGFDLQFDRPHFREDTDFGWRLQGLGKVPYAGDVAVFHPAQPRAIERESMNERVKFFCKDALLFRKHPERYRELFMREGHFLNTPGFADALLAGFADMGWVAEDLPEWMQEKISV